jgi:hypothetical protein
MTDTGWLPQMGFKLNSMHLKVEAVNEFHNQIASSVSKA